MSTDVGALIEDTRALVYGSQRRKLNKLSADPSTGTTWAFTYTPKFRSDTYLACEDEIVYVWDVDDGAKTATVERAQLGTTNTAHATGSLVEVNPLHAKIQIRRALQDDIRSWPSKVFAVGSLDLTASATSRAINLTGISADFRTILRVLRGPRTGEQSWLEVGFRYERNMPTADFASGVALFLDDYPDAGGFDLRVEFSKPFDVDTFTDATTLTSIGLGETMHDIPPYGVAWRVTSPREIRRTRTDAQGESRAAAEVPPNYIQRTAEDFRRLRNTRLEEEANRLAWEYGWRMGVG